jgi:enoyl-CoA hydratase
VIVNLATSTALVSGQLDRRGVAWVTLNNPRHHNALTMEMFRAIPHLLAELDNDPVARVIVVRGAGGSAFCAGADIRELPDGTGSEFTRTLSEFWEAWRVLSKPVIAMIQGHCVGGGLLLALQADIRLCSDDATFSIPATKLGVGYGLDVVEPVLEAIGPAWTADLLFSARALDATEAHAAGLVNRVLAADEVLTLTEEFADSIAGNAPLAVITAKAAIREARKPENARNRAKVEALVAACFESADYVEGRLAFSEKRAPGFVGR